MLMSVPGYLKAKVEVSKWLKTCTFYSRIHQPGAANISSLFVDLEGPESVLANHLDGQSHAGHSGADDEHICIDGHGGSCWW